MVTLQHFNEILRVCVKHGMPSEYHHVLGYMQPLHCMDVSTIYVSGTIKGRNTAGNNFSEVPILHQKYNVLNLYNKGPWDGAYCSLMAFPRHFPH